MYLNPLERNSKRKYDNMVLLLIPVYEQIKERNIYHYCDVRLNRSLSIEEFIVAFGKYKTLH